MRGLEFSAEECTKTFDSVEGSRLQIEPEEGHNPLNVVNTFEHELFEWELLFSGGLLKNLYIICLSFTAFALNAF